MACVISPSFSMISPFNELPERVIFPLFLKEFKNFNMKIKEKHVVCPDRVISIMKPS